MLFLYEWNPHFVKDIEALETVQNTVQKHCTKHCTKTCDKIEANIIEQLHALNLATLKESYRQDYLKLFRLQKSMF